MAALTVLGFETSLERATSMKQAISVVTLGVSDLRRSRAFYERIGWKASPASQAEIAFFDTGGLVLALFDAGALAEDAGVSPEGSGFTGFTLAHNVATKDAVAEILRDAVAAGGTLVKPGEDVFWGGHRGYFADPDGFLWEVAWNPLWPMDSNGHLRLPT